MVMRIKTNDWLEVLIMKQILLFGTKGMEKSNLLENIDIDFRV